MQSTDVTPQERIANRDSPGEFKPSLYISLRHQPTPSPGRAALPPPSPPLSKIYPSLSNRFASNSTEQDNRRKDRIIRGNMHVAEGHTRGLPGATRTPREAETGQSGGEALGPKTSAVRVERSQPREIAISESKSL